MRVQVQEHAFDPGSELGGFHAGRTDAGALVSFSGIVRSDDQAPIALLEIEHYPGMTEKAIRGIATEAVERWQLMDCLVIHRFGRLKPGDHIMMVATLAKHRAEAFEAAEFLMDYLKSRAPFWKREHSASGKLWVASRDKDEATMERWVRQEAGEADCG
ncbi:MAG: molybdenum cofactor biosynthesis protein MoaE [Rhodobacteraceae bacterium]|nr:molybdenum cofactor biosynthesis protein MoaE [Paracoccaceae bacterium]